MQSISKHFYNGAKQLPLLFLTILALFPIYFMVMTAFKSKGEYIQNKFGFPHSITFTNFSQVFGEGTFFKWFTNSFILTVGSVALSLVCAVMGAYAIAKFSFPGRGNILKIIVSLMVLPPVVMILPLFRMMADMNLINTYAGATIIYTGILLPFSVFLLTNFFRTVPNEIIESAQIDGSSSIGILFRIIVPLSLPAFITLMIVNSLWVWNELLISVIFLQDDSLKTLMVGLTVFKSRFNLNIPVTMAGLILSTLPVALLYLIGQKSFIDGLTAGSLKG
jgi:ABC-type glycerol-3-phosphate transport system permease component